MHQVFPRFSPFLLLLFCSLAIPSRAEIKEMTMRQAVQMAVAQNPDVLLARLDQQKARTQVAIQRDPFVPKVYAGSGLAYTNGFPTSIEGSAPSVFQARTIMTIFNRSQNYLVAQAAEGIRGAGADIARREEEVAYRVAVLFLDAEQAAR